MQPHICNTAPRMQHSPACPTQPCMPDAAPRAQCGHAKPGDCTSPWALQQRSPWQHGTRSLLKSALPPLRWSPPLHAGASPSHSEVARASTASGRRVMGQLTHTMQRAFGSHFARSHFSGVYLPRLCPPPPCAATTLLFLFLRKNFRCDF